ncbi:MAG: hypothetical protein AB1427_22085 [Thermodesulfobacteriota bacterium]
MILYKMTGIVLSLIMILPAAENESPLLDISFSRQGPVPGTFSYSISGIDQLGQLSGASSIRENTLICSGGGAIIPRSSSVWPQLGNAAQLKIQFMIDSAGTNARQALFTCGPLMTWPAVFIMTKDSPHYEGKMQFRNPGSGFRHAVTVFLPHITDAVGWYNMDTLIEAGVWHTITVMFDAQTHTMSCVLDAEHPATIIDPEFHVRTAFFENIYIGASGIVPLQSSVKDPFAGKIKSVRISIGKK